MVNEAGIRENSLISLFSDSELIFLAAERLALNIARHNAEACQLSRYFESVSHPCLAWLLLGLLVWYEKAIPRKEHIRIGPQLPKIIIQVMTVNCVPVGKAVLLRDARQTLTLLNNVDSRHNWKGSGSIFARIRFSE